MADMEVHMKKDNTQQALKAVEEAAEMMMEAIGIKAEKYAKALCPVGTPESTGIKGYRGGTLRNSITHVANKDSVQIGSNVEYAPYVELGTGPFFTPPPDWEKFGSSKGGGGGHGYVHPRKFLQPAIQNHAKEYEKMCQKILNSKLKGMP